MENKELQEILVKMEKKFKMAGMLDVFKNHLKSFANMEKVTMKN